MGKALAEAFPAARAVLMGRAALGRGSSPPRDWDAPGRDPASSPETPSRHVMAVSIATPASCETECPASRSRRTQRRARTLRRRIFRARRRGSLSHQRYRAAVCECGLACRRRAVGVGAMCRLLGWIMRRGPRLANADAKGQVLPGPQ